MPNLYLRELLESGFCGGYIPHAPALRIGRVHVALDNAIHDYNGKLEQLGSESHQTSLCGYHNIPYEHQKYFRECLTGISERFPACSISEQTHTMPNGTIITFMKFLDLANKVYIEPSYRFVSKEYHVPMYGIMCAYFCEATGIGVSVKTISALADFTCESQYPVIAAQLNDFLHSATTVDMRIPGPQCQSCELSVCTFKVDLMTLVYAWMKQKQKYDDYKNQLHEFLVMNGPTKIGAHLIYLKETIRRSLKKGAGPELKAALIDRLTVSQVDGCYKPDAQAIFRLIEKHQIPVATENLFEKSSSHSIDSGLSL